MDKETAEALEGSIKKWEGIVKGEYSDQGGDNCPLCQKFAKAVCSGCPVMKKMGQSDCRGTPYWSFWRAAGGWGRTGSTPLLILAAKKEVDFLKSLREKEVTGEATANTEVPPSAEQGVVARPEV